MVSKGLRVFLFLVLSFSCVAVFGQGTTSRFSGVVTDQSGAAVPGATVTLSNPSTSTKLTTVTGANGAFFFDLIQVGTYTVTVEKDGFKKYVSSNNVVNINQPTNINVALEVGDVSAVVNVDSSATDVQTSSSGNIGTTITTQSVESLPIVGLRGRNPLDLVNYQPGINAGANTGGGIHVNGSRDRSFNFTLDGIDINDTSAGGSNFTPLRPNPDSIQEFQVVTSGFTAELGRSSGAQVTFVTRGGTNDFHGSLFEFYQTPGLAANPFANNLLGVDRPQFVQHIFGGSIGGPIVNPGFGEGTPFFQQLKDKAFFFVNLQMLRASETRLAQRTVYTPQARAGVFRYIQGGRNYSAGTSTPSVDSSGNALFPVCTGSNAPCVNSYNIGNNPSGVGIDPALLAMINSMPLPNDYSSGDGLNIAGFNFNAPQREKQWDFVTRIDYKFSDSNVIYGRYAQGEQDTVGDSVNGGLPIFPDTPNMINTSRKPLNLAINWRISPSARFTNEFIFGYSRFSYDFGNPNPRADVPYSFNLVDTPYDNYNTNARTPSTVQWVDNMTFDLSPHLIKAGMNLRFVGHFDDRSSVAGTDIEGIVDFSSGVNNNFSAFGLPSSGINSNDLSRLRSQINDYLGRVGNYSQAFITNPSGTEFEPAFTRWNFRAKYPELDFYVQDTWRFSQRLSFDLGVRYEIKLTPRSEGLPVLGLSAPVKVGATPSDTIKWVPGELYKSDYNNLAPSVGMAWDPTGSGKTSVRLNYRLNYDRLPSQVFTNSVFQNAPGNNAAFPSNNTFGQNGGLLRNLPAIVPDLTPSDFRQPPPFSPNIATVFDPDLQFPMIHSWSASFQHELFKNNVLEVNYIGKKGTHLFGGYNVNQVDLNASVPGISETFLQAFNSIRANSTYSSPLINALLTGSSTNGAGTTSFRSFNSSNISNNNVASAAATLAARTTTVGGVVTPIFVANGYDPFLFVDFPQFSGAFRVLDTNDYSFYNGLEVMLKRRFVNGLSYQIAYTLSKSEDTRSFDPTFSTVSTGTSQSASSTPFDINNRRLNYAWSDFDRRHVVSGYYTWELPWGRGRAWGSDMPKALDAVIGGWQLSGLLTVQSGRPFTVYSGRYTYSNVVSSFANCSGCTRNMGSVIEENGTSYFFSAAQQAMFSEPDSGSLGNTGRNYFIGPGYWQTDASISKKFKFSERMSFDLRLDAQNVTNSTSYGFPTTTYTSSTFGRIRTSINSGPRRMQLSARFSF
ncbi:MAG: TonB-dependent receptor domain-containing protein [Pyrinomonadaceae bacterium]